MSDLKNDGYVILKKVFSDEQLAPLRTLTQEIVDYAEMNLEDPFYKYYLGHRADQGALYDLFQRHPEYQFIVRNEKILDELEKVIGHDIMMYENCLVYKPKGKNNSVPWHQDFLSRPHEIPKYIVWVALDDVRIENGAMKVIPGSHTKGFYPWFRVKGETHHDRIDPKYIEEDKAIYVEMDAGDVLIFSMFLLHSSNEVHSELPRRAFRVSYQSMNEIFTPRGTPIVVRGGRPDFLSKQYSAPSSTQKLPFHKKVMHAIGRRLINA